MKIEIEIERLNKIDFLNLFKVEQVGFNEIPYHYRVTYNNTINNEKIIIKSRETYKKIKFYFENIYKDLESYKNNLGKIYLTCAGQGWEQDDPNKEKIEKYLDYKRLLNKYPAKITVVNLGNIEERSLNKRSKI